MKCFSCIQNFGHCVSHKLHIHAEQLLNIIDCYFRDFDFDVNKCSGFMKLSRQTLNNISLESFNVYPKTLIEYRRLQEVISLVNERRYEIDLALLSGFKSSRRLSRLFDKYFTLSYKEVLSAVDIHDFDINELVSLLDAFMPRKMNCT